MRKTVVWCAVLILLAGHSSMTAQAKKKKKTNIRITFSEVVEPPFVLNPITEMTELSEAELIEAGYTRTGTISVQAATRKCMFKKDGSEKCKTLHNVHDCDSAILSEVMKHGGGLVLMASGSEEIVEDVMGKVCLSYRPDRHGLAECSQSAEAKVGKKYIQTRVGSVWHQLP